MMTALTEGWPLFLQGLGVTLALFLISGFGSIVFGAVLAAMRVSPVAPLRVVATGYTEMFRNTPLTLILFACAIVLPALEIRFSETPQLNFFLLAVLGLTAYTSAFIGEALRSGINAIPVGQAEAARSIGLTFGQTLVAVILPQALRSVIPPVISILIALVKNTSVAGGFVVVELFAQGRRLINDYGSQTLLILLVVAALYLSITVTLGIVASVVERKYAVSR